MFGNPECNEVDMNKLQKFQKRARALARSGMFYGLPPLEFELRFEDGYDEGGQAWLADPAIREDLDLVCREARAGHAARSKAA
jgi:hypothetical protein